ncbi:multicopper oxidase [Aplosporella prunicola CBS 121167]|uniref:laccase n=1 Tax=Aplosporella prunicola CBS 121167 TaxID=1176127 RepID=A0A6A6BNM7_9PEZI|nr:multicopper oxidase [Aplosporella prunicola CBS 121167]KAF2145686.1 multicopper oxidase [Aplosporella prunicola CBS 121167]
MILSKKSVIAFVALGAQALGAIIPDEALIARATTSLANATSAISTATSSNAPSSTSTLPPADGDCDNGPNTRQCWEGDYSLSDDFDEKTPPAGNVVSYNLVLRDYTCEEVAAISPSVGDGSTECTSMQLFNGQYPGPVLRGKWGDTFQITVTNELESNGTSIHWHGIRQLNNCPHDGVNGVTECPIPPGHSYTYVWKATQYGSTWYHSHHSAQYGNGVLGSIVIDGPASENYDIDLGPLPLTDHYNETAWYLNSYNLHNLPPYPPDNILVNGTAVNEQGAGRYNIVSVQKNKKYRLRLINMSVDTMMVFSIQGHDFKLITSDLVPIKPITVNSVLIAIGQRYDIVFETDQDVDNYWMFVQTATNCNSATSFASSTIVQGGVLSYEGASTSLPAYASPPALPAAGICVDQPDLKPWWSEQIPSDDFLRTVSGIDVVFNGTALSDNLVQWAINGSAMNIDWSAPTLQYVADKKISQIPRSYNVFNMTNHNQWYYWIITNESGGLAHPIHLHGHDAYVLYQSSTHWDGNIGSLTLDNPMRRDVYILPANGQLILAFPADNPGAWLMHCHIAWHVTDGLSLQFLETPELFAFDSSVINPNCEAWREYWNGPHPYEKEVGDSGL